MLDPESSRQRHKAPQVDKRQRPALAVQPAGRRQAAGKPAHDLFVEQRKQRRPVPLKNREPQRVRAEVDDADAAGG
jgi:hypothetical protein